VIVVVRLAPVVRSYVTTPVSPFTTLTFSSWTPISSATI
jgi:hypothetical protein